MPELETERLILGVLTLDDLDALAAIQADPEVMRFFPSGPQSREETLRELERCIAIQAEHGFSLWAALDRRDGRLVGRCGLIPQDLQGRRRGRDRLPAGPDSLGPRPGDRGGDRRSATTDSAGSGWTDWSRSSTGTTWPRDGWPRRRGSGPSG